MCGLLYAGVLLSMIGFGEFIGACIAWWFTSYSLHLTSGVSGAGKTFGVDNDSVHEGDGHQRGIVRVSVGAMSVCGDWEMCDTHCRMPSLWHAHAWNCLP